MCIYFRPDEAVSISGWETVRVELADKTPPPPVVDFEINGKNLPLKEGCHGDNILEFYWIDMYEDHYKQPGTVYIFGKVWVEKANSFVRSVYYTCWLLLFVYLLIIIINNFCFNSCCVSVKNIERCMYFLPRIKVHINTNIIFVSV